MIKQLLRSLAGVCVALCAVPTSAQWSTDELSQARYNLTATSVGDLAIFAGGEYGPLSNRVDIYNASSGTWTTFGLSVARDTLAATSVGSLAMFAGGVALWESDRVDVYDAEAGTWSTATLSEPRKELAATTAGQKAFFAGGLRVGGGFYDVVDVYDLATDTWSTDHLSTARFGLAATSVGSKAIFAGGKYAGDVVDIYDTVNNTWTTAQLSEGRSYLAATSIGDKALFAGGWTNSGPSERVDIYDVATDTWTTANLSLARWGLSATTVGSKAIFAGGYVDGYPFQSTSRVDIYDWVTDTWSTSELSVHRGYLAATTVGNQAMFGGGYGGINGYIESRVDIYTDAFATAYCFGDGSGTPCPCANDSALSDDQGCLNSTGTGGVATAVGSNRVTHDDLRVVAQNLLPAQAAMLFSAEHATNGGTGIPLGDGLRCAGGNAVRMGVMVPDGFGVVDWGPGLGGTGGWSAGDVRRIQVWYRDPSGPCGSGFNLTQGLEIEFAP